MLIRAATRQDSDAVWAIMEPVVRAGETYTIARDVSRHDALAYWFAPGHEVFVAEEDGAIAGSYLLRANQRGGGEHVANCGYMTAQHAMGRGVARAMCQHSLDTARERGFVQCSSTSCQYEPACRTTVGCLRFCNSGQAAGSFSPSALGYVDALVMYRAL